MIAIAAAFALGLREPVVSEALAGDATYRSLLDAVRLAMRGAVPGMRAIFVATLLLQLTFQTFTTWYALHGTERFAAPLLALASASWTLPIVAVRSPRRGRGRDGPVVRPVTDSSRAIALRNQLRIVVILIWP